MTNTINYIVTTHAKRRMKARMGIKPSACKRQFQLAVERNMLGTKKLPSFVTRWITSATELRNDIQYKKDVALYNKHAFVYSMNGDEYTLITVLETPEQFKKYM